MLLSMAGAVLGLGFAALMTYYLAHQGSIALPLLSSLRVDAAAFAWTLLVATISAVLFGLAPAFKMSGKNIQEALKDSGHGTTEGQAHERMRSVLVVSEVALACVLLVGAGLLLRSFLRVLDVDLGFEADRAAALRVDYDDGGKPAQRGAILEEMLRRVKAIPGIEDAGITDMLPLDRNRSWGLGAKGVVYRKDESPDAFVYVVTPGYLGAMGMHLRKGRDLDWSDKPDSERVVVMNEAAAEGCGPGGTPWGRSHRLTERIPGGGHRFQRSRNQRGRNIGLGNLPSGNSGGAGGRGVGGAHPIAATGAGGERNAHSAHA